MNKGLIGGGFLFCFGKELGKKGCLGRIKGKCGGSNVEGRDGGNSEIIRGILRNVVGE